KLKTENTQFSYGLAVFVFGSEALFVYDYVD
nr:hypothetical protein [Tanacetum cinerariifolium]